jgi:Cytochrome P460
LRTKPPIGMGMDGDSDLSKCSRAISLLAKERRPTQGDVYCSGRVNEELLAFHQGFILSSHLHVWEIFMEKSVWLMAGIVALTACIAYLGLEPARADGEAGSVLGGKLPAGYRDWKLVSVAHEEGALNDIRAILGNDIAIKAYREGKLPFPDGAIIARLAYNYVPSEENNKVFAHEQSFVAGAPTNVQFMVKDSGRYAATGGWGFAQFNDGKPIEAAKLAACFGCHVPVKDRDYLFTKYAP